MKQHSCLAPAPLPRPPPPQPRIALCLRCKQLDQVIPREEEHLPRGLLPRSNHIRPRFGVGSRKNLKQSVYVMPVRTNQKTCLGFGQVPANMRHSATLESDRMFRTGCGYSSSRVSQERRGWDNGGLSLGAPSGRAVARRMARRCPNKKSVCAS